MRTGQLQPQMRLLSLSFPTGTKENINNLPSQTVDRQSSSRKRHDEPLLDAEKQQRRRQRKNVRDAFFKGRKKLKQSKLTLQQVAVGRDRRQQRQEHDGLDREHSVWVDLERGRCGER